jgi:hypothetical protein
MNNRHWRITGLISLPRLVLAAEPPEPGSLLPGKIDFKSRLAEKVISEVGRLGLVSLAPNPYPTIQLDPATNCDLAALSLWTQAPSAENALESVEASLELLLDDMSFQLQSAVRVHMLEVIDVTPPLEVGQERDMTLYPFPLGWTYPKFQESVFPQDSVVPLIPSLRSVDGLQDRKTRAALRWYVKALAAPWDVDRFALLWIALEILCSARASSVEKPYVARCGHEIGSCPRCGKSTSRGVQGPTLISFLEELGVQTTTASELWRTRQMFHGNNDLTKESIAVLPSLLLTLKSAVARGLKVAAGLSPLTLPHVASTSLGVSKTFALGGTRKLEPSDLSAF